MSVHQDLPSPILSAPEASAQPQPSPHLHRPGSISFNSATLPNHHNPRAMDRTEEEHRIQEGADPVQAHVNPPKRTTVDNFVFEFVFEYQNQRMAEPNHSTADPPPTYTANGHESFVPDENCRVKGTQFSCPKTGVDLERGGYVDGYGSKRETVDTIRYGWTRVSRRTFARLMWFKLFLLIISVVIVAIAIDPKDRRMFPQREG